MKHASGEEGGGLKSLWDVPTLLVLLNLSVKSPKLVQCSGENSLNMLFPWDTRWRTTDREVCTFNWALSHLLIRRAIPSVSSVPPQKWNLFKKKKKLHLKWSNLNLSIACWISHSSAVFLCFCAGGRSSEWWGPAQILVWDKKNLDAAEENKDNTRSSLVTFNTC